jgi:hypothetical protein
VNYRNLRFTTLSGLGYKANYSDAETGEHYWISGCKKRGNDRLYPGLIEIDLNIREEYWTVIRGRPEDKHQSKIRCSGKHRRKAKLPRVLRSTSGVRRTPDFC